MRTKLSIVLGLSAIALIGYGMTQSIEQDGNWLLCLWTAAPFLGWAFWLRQPPLPRGLTQSVANLGLVISLGFGLLSIQLLRQQFIHAKAIYHKIKIDPQSGQVTSNVRPVLASQRVLRGKLFDRSNQLLVQSTEVNGGFAYRNYPIAEKYPPTAFSNVVGFFSTRFGQSGLEATYSDYLTGEKGNPITQLQSNFLGQPEVGNDLHLTLNADLQGKIGQLLAERSGSVVVLRPQSGEVLALVSNPGFDPRQLSFNFGLEDWAAENARISRYWDSLNSDSAGQPLINRATQGQYPPGSVFKTVTAIAALENPKVADPDNVRCLDKLQVEAGSPPVVNAVASLASRTGDPANLEKVYAYSCNVAFAQYALRLGKDLMSKQAAAFDIFAPGEVPQNYEAFTDLPTLPSRLAIDANFLDRPSALADTGYGQGQLLVTPLQMALVAAAIGNEGTLMQPYLVQSITRPDSSVIFTQFPKALRLTMSKETATKMRANMKAVGQYGFGKIVSNYVPGVTVGGKSGTAEHGTGSTPHAWFMALAPIDQPKYAVAVMLESGGEGSSVGATLAGQVLKAAFETEK